MDKVIITIPDWVVIVIGVYFILSIIDTCMSIYISFLKLKLNKINRDIAKSCIKKNKKEYIGKNE